MLMAKSARVENTTTMAHALPTAPSSVRSEAAGFHATETYGGALETIGARARLSKSTGASEAEALEHTAHAITIATPVQKKTARGGARAAVTYCNGEWAAYPSTVGALCAERSVASLCPARRVWP